MDLFFYHTQQLLSPQPSSLYQKPASSPYINTIKFVPMPWIRDKSQAYVLHSQIFFYSLPAMRSLSFSFFWFPAGLFSNFYRIWNPFFSMFSSRHQGKLPCVSRRVSCTQVVSTGSINEGIFQRHSLILHVILKKNGSPYLLRCLLVSG